MFNCLHPGHPQGLTCGPPPPVASSSGPLMATTPLSWAYQQGFPGQVHTPGVARKGHLYLYFHLSPLKFLFLLNDL